VFGRGKKFSRSSQVLAGFCEEREKDNERKMPGMASDPLSIQRALARCVSKRREIRAAYIFGSAATGRPRPDSDLDVAVLLARPLTQRRSLAYRLKLMTELGAALHRSDVDVVILNDASPLLAQRVLSKGKLLFEKIGVGSDPVSGEDCGSVRRSRADVRNADPLSQETCPRGPHQWLIGTSSERGSPNSASTSPC
jgi:predicted nucleotidyltransferase